MKIFGDEKHNYDEAKRFCYIANQHRNESDANFKDKCSVFSIGSNNKWNFEEAIHAATNCTIDTFDCTINGIVPDSINNRTRFHKYCLSPFSFRDHKNGVEYNTLSELNKISNIVNGPDYLKIDVEVNKWI